jgi:DNA-binding PadR family transcriptional regulator
MSLVTHVAVFFALNPDEQLTAADIGTKWGVVPGNVGNTLRYAEEKGWVRSSLEPNPERISKKIRVYTPGPRLLKEIGR